ncbi:MAG: hypothetical protein ACR2QV_15105 [Gammaproteobacteria bacterium]
MKKTPIAAAVAAAFGLPTANSAVITVFLDVNAGVAGSMGAPAALILSNSTATWSYDTVTGVVTGSGRLVQQSQVAPTLPGQVFTRNVDDLSFGNSIVAGATFFECIDGSFSNAVFASFCGNYNFGANYANESTITYGPGLAFSRTIGGDDAIIGTQQSISEYDGSTTTDGGLTDTTVEISNIDPGITSGQRLVFIKQGEAIDDDPLGVSGYTVGQNTTGNTLDIGANDVRWPAPAVGNMQVTGPATGTLGGTFTINSDPDMTNVTVTYDAPAVTGTDTWVYTVTDTSGGITDSVSDMATVTITVAAGGTAVDDAGATTSLLAPADVLVGVNDFGFTDPVTVTITAPPSQGTATPPPGSAPKDNIIVTYQSTATPGTAPYVDTYTYQITDGVATATADVTITVNNTLPVANDLPGVSLDTQGVSPASATVTINVDAGGDIAGNMLGDAPSTVTAMDGNEVAQMVAGADITLTATAFTSAGDVVPYTITDTDTEADSGMIMVDIPDVAPVIDNVAQTISSRDTMSVSVPVTQVGNGAPADHMISVSQPQLGTVSNVALTPAADAITFDYLANAAGIDALTVQLTDGDGSVGSATATVTVPDELPQVQDASETLIAGNSVTVSLASQLGNGTVADHTVTVSGAQFGTVSGETLNAAGDAITFDYTSNGTTGNESLTVELTDVDGDMASGTATVMVVTDLVPQVPANFQAEINFQGANTVKIPVQLGDGTAAEHTTTVTGAQRGTVSNETVEDIGQGPMISFVYTPPTSGAAFEETLTTQLTDNNGDVATGAAQLSIGGAAVTVPGQDSLPGKSSALSPVSLGALLAALPLLRNRRRKR